MLQVWIYKAGRPHSAYSKAALAGCCIAGSSSWERPGQRNGMGTESSVAGPDSPERKKFQFFPWLILHFGEREMKMDVSFVL